jgi:hypothetical protein
MHSLHRNLEISSENEVFRDLEAGQRTRGGIEDNPSADRATGADEDMGMADRAARDDGDQPTALG